MSVQNQTVKNVYAGNGSTTVFPFTFALLETDGEYVKVYVTNDAGVSEETENFLIDTQAKTVTYPKAGDPLPEGKKIVIRRELPNEQDLNLENLGPFFAEDIEGELDKEVMMIQQLAEEVNRAVKVDMASNRTPDEFMQDIADAVEQAKDYADEASDSADDADASVTKAATWAEGTDADVSALGGTHSSKGWADVSKGHSDDASGYATAASGSAASASTSETNAAYWAEGTDGQVAPLGGTHSAKGWAADSAASAASVVANVDKAQKWAEGSDADVTPLGGEHSSKGWSDQAKAWAMSMANLPVATIVPWGGSSNTPPVGFLFCDGSAVSRTMYPDLFAAIGTTWGAGDGSTTFNLPDLPFPEAWVGSFDSEDTVPVVFGDTFTASTGVYNNSGVLGNQGVVVRDSTGSPPHYRVQAFDGSVAYGDQSEVISSLTDFSGGTASPLYADLSSAESTVTPQASSNIRYIIKAFDGQTPDSALIDITQYAADLANKATRSLDNLTQAGEDHFLEQDFAIIYPNGGSKGSPANVTNDTRYVESNPFSGYIVSCIAEVLYNGEWGSSGWYTEYAGGNRGFGVSANQLDDGGIVVQTGNDGVMLISKISGSPFGYTENTTIFTLPCRVKIFKIGKVASA